MYWQDLDVLCLYWGCIRCIRCIKIVFGMYCVSISNVLEFRINCLFMVIALMIAGILTGFHHWRMYWNHQCQQIQHKYILNTFLITVPIHPKPLKNMHNTDSIHLHYIQAIISTSSAWVWSRSSLGTTVRVDGQCRASRRYHDLRRPRPRPRHAATVTVTRVTAGHGLRVSRRLFKFGVLAESQVSVEE